ncbi:hypothetical protein D3OALGA1CA_421 [Olavius algarvensis associated proteobacterium Delta 3]|nr:hypothetical protein D3OALGA1CA_421 [Olavius algarvensis associated proteobacterium Delta 3]
MKIAIHQPEFMPWLGFFNKMKRSDRYVVFDHVQFKKRYFENRNRIKIRNESIWITLPVRSRKKFTQPLMEVEIDNSTKWQRKMSEKIKHCYSKSRHYHPYFEVIDGIIHACKYERLIDFNMAFIDFFRGVFDIDTPLVFSSELDVAEYQVSDLILEICKKMNAAVYLCGPSGKDYLDLESFEKANIEIVWQQFEHPEYPQTGDAFIPNLSALDFVFCCGNTRNHVI